MSGKTIFLEIEVKHTFCLSKESLRTKEEEEVDSGSCYKATRISENKETVLSLSEIKS